jgi:2-succinyl-6-hydroxy-2,4-cyclohexadiene-1-carboxylate synthase
LVHGFTQTGRCWASFDTRLAARFTVVRVDAPGHGSSAHVAAGIEAGAELLGETVGAASYLGYSMGGRLALRLALDHPLVVERLVLIGASPGLRDPAERLARVDLDEARARHLEAIGLDAFLAEWLAQPLFASLPRSAACLDERRRNTVEGLAASLRLAGTGAQEPAWDRLHTLAMPVLLVTGARDGKFTELAKAMAAEIGSNANMVTVPDAGHAAHLERPEVCAALVQEWFGGP